MVFNLIDRAAARGCRGRKGSSWHPTVGDAKGGRRSANPSSNAYNAANTIMLPVTGLIRRHSRGFFSLLPPSPSPAHVFRSGVSTQALFPSPGPRSLDTPISPCSNPRWPPVPMTRLTNQVRDCAASVSTSLFCSLPGLLFPSGQRASPSFALPRASHSRQTVPRPSFTYPSQHPFSIPPHPHCHPR